MAHMKALGKSDDTCSATRVWAVGGGHETHLPLRTASALDEFLRTGARNVHLIPGSILLHPCFSPWVLLVYFKVISTWALYFYGFL